MRKRPLRLFTGGCACGAQVEQGKKCVKCRARARWARRKGNNIRHSDQGGDL